MPIANVVGDDAEPVVLLDLRQVVFTVVLPQRLVTPRHFFLNEIAAYERSPHELEELDSDADISLPIAHCALLYCLFGSPRHPKVCTSCARRTGTNGCTPSSPNSTTSMSLCRGALTPRDGREILLAAVPVGWV